MFQNPAVLWIVNYLYMVPGPPNKLHDPVLHKLCDYIYTSGPVITHIAKSTKMSLMAPPFL